jgi:hypothetical protein
MALVRKKDYTAKSPAERKKIRQLVYSVYKESMGSLDPEELEGLTSVSRYLIKQFMVKYGWASRVKPGSDPLFKLQEKLGLTGREVAYCLEYLRCRSWQGAYLKTFGSDIGLSTCPSFLSLQADTRIRSYVKQAHEIMQNEALVSMKDIKSELLKIAFANISQVAELQRDGSVLFADPKTTDYGAVSEISVSKNGTKVKMHNKLAALKELKDLTGDDDPTDSLAMSRKIEVEKLRLMRERFEWEKSQAEGGIDKDFDDGFLDALKDARNPFDEKDEWGDEDLEEEEDLGL